MAKKIKWYCDSGANAFSRNEGEVTFSELDIPEDEWGEMTEKEQEAIMREYAWQSLDWGWEVVDDDE